MKRQRDDTKQPSPPLPSKSGPVLIPPILRTRTACASCRKRKVKCNGDSPCDKCLSRGLSCTPGKHRRGRKEKTGKATEIVDGSNSANPLSQQVYRSITGTDASACSTTQLQYGPSSNFSFLQQLHSLIIESEVFRQSSAAQGGDTISVEAISEFGMRSIFFGKESDGMMASSSYRFYGEYWASFLPVELADEFLETYLSVTQHVLPFCDPEMLSYLVHGLYKDTSKHSHNLDSALALIVLAIGALLRSEIKWAKSLYTWTQSAIGGSQDVVNLRSVQILMLLAEFQSLSGRPNAGYLLCGKAIFKSLAGGLHRHTISHTRNQGIESELDQQLIRERRSTFWCIYSYERTNCLFIGRPATLNDGDIDIPYPIDGSPLRAMVHLAKIAHRVHAEVYAPQSGPVANLWKTIQSIQEEMAHFHQDLEKPLKFPLTKEELQDPEFPLTNRTVVLAFRACMALLFDVFRAPEDRARCKISLDGVSEGLRCFQHLPGEGPMVISSRAIQKVADLAEESIRGEEKNTSASGMKRAFDRNSLNQQLKDNGERSKTGFENNNTQGKFGLNTHLNQINQGGVGPAAPMTTSNDTINFVGSNNSYIDPMEADFNFRGFENLDMTDLSYLWTNSVTGADYDALLWEPNI
ncbi:MAG: hypothetical protein M1834_009122 [Cirrosporium novae-zelandiae]|nr:MAG: hypothetical protein M1834_009122 [Cirrosporium novae-zelandiae]